MKSIFILSLAALSIGATRHAAATDLTLDARDFLPAYAEAQWHESGAGSLICTGGIGYFAAQLRLPRASVLKEISVWGGDLSASEDATITLTRVCQPELISASPTFTNLVDVQSTGSAGAYYDSATFNEPAYSTATCTYSVLAALGNNACTTNLSVAKVRVRYVDDLIFEGGFE